MATARSMADLIHGTGTREGQRIGVTDFVAVRCRTCKNLFGAYRGVGTTCNVCSDKRARDVNGTRERWIDPRYQDSAGRGRVRHPPN